MNFFTSAAGAVWAALLVVSAVHGQAYGAPEPPPTKAVSGPSAPAPEKADAPRNPSAAPDPSVSGDFHRRLATLKEKFTPFRVRMAPADDPTPSTTEPQSDGPVLASGRRLGIFTPPMLSAEDIQLVVQDHIADVRRCYKKQLRRDPEWRDELILDIAIKRNGRVSEVGVAPRRVRRAVIGRCLMRSVPRWRFPRFTGEVGDGITQEVLNASFPFDFGPR